MVEPLCNGGFRLIVRCLQPAYLNAAVMGWFYMHVHTMRRPFDGLGEGDM